MSLKRKQGQKTTNNELGVFRRGKGLRIPNTIFKTKLKWALRLTVKL